MKGWRTTSIGELVDSIQTWNPLRANPDEVFDYIDLTAVDQSAKAIVGAREVACSEAPSRARQLVSTDDILVSTVRPNLNGIAKVNAEHNGATASTGFCVLRPRPNLLSSSYLFHWVKSPQFVTDMVRKATGASYPAVSDRIIFESPIFTPAIAEQRRIAAILDQADALRAKRREALAQLDNLTQSIFIEMFGDPTRNHNKFPVHSLGAICDVRDGTHDSPKYVSSGFPLVTTKNLRDGIIDFTDVNLISEADYSAINKRSKVDRGDLLMPMIGTIGSPILVCIEPNFAIKNMALIKFTEHSPHCQFILSFLQSDAFEKMVTSESKGGTQKFLSLGAIRGLQIPIPPLPLQKNFATRIQSVEALKTTYGAALQELNSLFASLQHRAFRGEL